MLRRVCSVVCCGVAILSLQGCANEDNKVDVNTRNSEVDNWIIKNGVPSDEGHTLKTGRSRLSEVKGMCEANSKCVGFAYLPEYGRYYLKEKNTGFNADLATYSQKHKGYTWEWHYIQSRALQWIKKNGVPSDEGLTLKTGKTRLSKVKRMCEANSECVGFAYLPEDGTYYLKEKNTGFKADLATYSQKHQGYTWEWHYIQSRASAKPSPTPTLLPTEVPTAKPSPTPTLLPDLTNLTESPIESPTYAPTKESEFVHQFDECDNLREGTPENDTDVVPSEADYNTALETLNIQEVKTSIKNLMTQSKKCFPADDGNYGPLFVRLAWHCSGTYRQSDHAGGCHGGRIRFEPERSWGDNTNLDKARAFLVPIKKQFGDGLSWGDLIIAAGTVSLDEMGFPRKKPLCFGRMDDKDGTDSKQLLIKDEKLAPSHPELIYVEPDGPNSDGDLKMTTEEVRRVFKNMGHTEEGTVALIGGGHAFGRAHGACKHENIPGKSPKESFKDGEAPWLNKCGLQSGTGVVTSGFEGPWTTTKNQWNNEFFVKLMDKEWKRKRGVGGKYEWRIKNPEESERELMRFTADYVLKTDDTWNKISQRFADNMTELNEAFDDAWHKLTMNGDFNKWADKRRCDMDAPFPEDEFKHQTARRLQQLNTDMNMIV